MQAGSVWQVTWSTWWNFAPCAKVGAVTDKWRKACVLGKKCNKRSYVLAITSNHAPNQNLIIKSKNLGYFNFFTTAPKCSVFSLK